MDGPALIFEGEDAADEEGEESCVSIPLVIGIATPFLAWGILYLTRPNFIMKKDIANNYYERDAWKILMWVVIVTVVVWVIIYIISYAGNGAPNNFLCMKNTNSY